MIAPIYQPSDPTKQRVFRYPTTAEMIDVSGIAPDKEEAATTLFLDKVQADKATWENPGLWTGEDRRFFLFWIGIHIMPEKTRLLTYSCDCGKLHAVNFDLMRLADGYQKISGKAERDRVFEDEPIIVKPLNGLQLEELEKMRLPIVEYERNIGIMESDFKNHVAAYGMNEKAVKMQDDIDAYRKMKGDLSGDYQKRKFQIEVMSVSMAFDFVNDTEKNEKKRRTNKEKRIEQLPDPKFLELKAIVTEALQDMRHGLDTALYGGKLYLLTPPFECPDEKGGTKPRLRIPFRTFIYFSTRISVN